MTIASITPELAAYQAANEPSTVSVTFRKAAQVTDAEILALLRTEDKPLLSKTLPRIPAPQAGADPHDIEEIPPSMGAAVLSLIAKLAAESRRASADQRAAEVNNVIEQIRGQAQDMRDKADKQFAYALTASIITGTMGLVTLGASAAFAPKMMPGMTEAELSAKQGMFSTITGAINSIGTGLSGSIQAVGTSEGGLADSKIKLKEAEQERIRSMIDQLRSTEESLMDLVRKAIAVQDAIQQNTNQTRSKILG